MLPERQKSHPRQRGHTRTDLDHEIRNRSVPDPYMNDQPLSRSNNRQDHGKHYLPGIGNYHRADGPRPTQNKNQRRTSQLHNRSAIDQRPSPDERNITPMHAHSQNNSVDRPLEKPLFYGDNSYEYDYPEDTSFVGYDHPDYTSGGAVKTQNSPKQNYYEKPNGDSFRKVIIGINAKPSREEKKAYGQYLLEQMKANENKKNYEKRQRQEEDRKMLNEPNFFDGFGRSRDRFLKKYRSKMLDSPEPIADNTKQMPPITFDKIHNHHRNYNIYHPLANEEINQPLKTNSVPPLRIIRNHTDEKQNPLNTHSVNHTIQPHYNHELLYPPEELETNVIDSFRGQSLEDQSGQRRSKSNKIENKRVSKLKPSESQKSKTEMKRDRSRPSEGRLSWKPSTDRFISEQENYKNHMLKLEYQKVLDQQALEKQLKKEYENKVREMEDMLEELRLSRERLLKELETNPNNAVTPKIGSTPKIQHQSHSQTPNGKIAFNNQQGGHINTRQNHHQRQNSQRGGGGAAIVLQPGDFNHKKNKSLPKNLSSKRTIGYNKSSSRNFHDKSDTDISTFPTYQDDPSKAEIRLLREELRINYQKFQDELADVKNQIRKPVDHLKPEIKEPSTVKGSESKRSLANETKFVPFQNNYGQNNHMKPEKLLPYNYYNKPHLLKSPDSYHEQNFPNSRMTHDDEMADAPNYEREMLHRRHHEKESMDKLKNLASMIEISVKDQNLELKREIKNLKEQISKLMEGKGNQSDYYSINKRLNQIKDARDDSPPVHSAHFKQTYSTTKKSNVDEESPAKSTISKYQREEPKVTKPSSTNSNMIDYQKFYPKIVQENRFETRPSEPKTNDSKPTMPIKSNNQLKSILDHYSEMEKIKRINGGFSKPLRLKKRTKGIKRRMRIGEEDKAKKDKLFK